MLDETSLSDSSLDYIFQKGGIRVEDWRLSKAEYDILLSYIGCGDILNADILVFGNEEGTGGYTVTENVKARTRLITTDESSDVRNYCIEANNWREGFYYPNLEGLFEKNTLRILLKAFLMQLLQGFV
ncbi:hypothetical protein PAEAM_39120 [Paenibacillus sp. GM1FR]|uniref:hypothetical protein n=1 Tax=Paenibacillus sp. GM1FR TaxID=2059267 RepID=UPI000C275767|nr:hypothetical protein [Paenibacillus sp. GM1FR]PJN57805.1 hypothetical protein PAEAM_39120 [Paenibacillus sp. GM1FR]